MKRVDVATMVAAVVVLSGLLFGTAGCDREMADEVAIVSGAYLGEMVSLLATAYLEEAFGAESTDDHDELSHDTGPLNDHEN
ncbi:MAG: hypothetical protein JSV19_07330 [Phycisphaerales bacterium]|nr:MAG: hypothetical protein JSV19_07330 [Phycisphaerales bacterium]